MIAKHLFRRLRRCTSGVALIEFAIGLPVFLTLTLTGAETANWIITKMRVSQLALQISDNAARMGTGSQLQAKTVAEVDVNDVLTGGGLQAGELDLYNNGRVIISDLERVPSTSPQKYFIRWQRCRGLNTHASKFGVPAVPDSKGKIPTNQQMDGMGPAGRQVQAQEDNATMFVEVYYVYKPLVSSKLAFSTDFDEIASMAVRDRRDLIGGDNGIYNPPPTATKSTCDKFTAT